jgi:hypothetical protein
MESEAASLTTASAASAPHFNVISIIRWARSRFESDKGIPVH